MAHSIRLFSCSVSLCNLLSLCLQLVVGLVCLKGCGGEAVVLPPRDQRGHGGDTGGDQLLHGLALDGQHGLAAGAQQLIGQGQQQAGFPNPGWLLMAATFIFLRIATYRSTILKQIQCVYTNWLLWMWKMQDFSTGGIRFT